MRDAPLKHAPSVKMLFIGIIAALPLLITGCTTTASTTKASSKTTATNKVAKSGVTTHKGVKTYAYTVKDRECLERAMFFESARSSRAGLVAVGTVVMNRLVSEKYPETICGVVGQKNQFAPGVMTRAMNSKALPDVKEAADAVLKGERHPDLKSAMFFHTAGLKFPYRNMHYVLVAGGNSFYEKRGRDGKLESPLPETPYMLAMASEAPKNPVSVEKIDNIIAENAPVAEAVQTASTTNDPAAAAIDPIVVAGVNPERIAPVIAEKAFNGASAQHTLSAQAGMQLAAYEMTQPAAASAFIQETASQQKADAIGALLLKQNRPQPLL